MAVPSLEEILCHDISIVGPDKPAHNKEMTMRRRPFHISEFLNILVNRYRRHAYL